MSASRLTIVIVATSLFWLSCSKRVNSQSLHCEEVGTSYISVQLMIDNDLVSQCANGKTEFEQYIADEFGEVDDFYKAVSESITSTCLRTRVVDHFYVDQDVTAKGLLLSDGTSTGAIASNLVKWRANNAAFLSGRPTADVLMFLRENPNRGSGYAYVDVIDNPRYAISFVDMGQICGQRGISMYQVIAHEIGHILSLEHRPENNAVMGPIVGSHWTRASIRQLNRKIAEGAMSKLSTTEPASSPTLPLANPPLQRVSVEPAPVDPVDPVVPPGGVDDDKDNGIDVSSSEVVASASLLRLALTASIMNLLATMWM